MFAIKINKEGLYQKKIKIKRVSTYLATKQNKQKNTYVTSEL
jgi:hypothetical protein